MALLKHIFASIEYLIKGRGGMIAEVTGFVGFMILPFSGIFLNLIDCRPIVPRYINAIEIRSDREFYFGEGPFEFDAKVYGYVFTRVGIFGRLYEPGILSLNFCHLFFEQCFCGGFAGWAF